MDIKDINTERFYTPKDGYIVEFFLKKTMSVYAELIGSLSQEKCTTHDIDILLPNHKRTTKTINKLAKLLEPKNGYVYTDWGGVYFRDTFFGDIDIFFTKPK